MAQQIKRTDIFTLVRHVIVIDEILQADLRVGDIQPPHDSTPLYSAAHGKYFLQRKYNHKHI